MLVLGNWKLHTTLGEAVALATAVAHGAPDGVEVGVCPPFVWLDAVAGRLRGTAVALGAQTVSAESAGAFTGEVSAAMLAELGCRYALVGHSERRQHDGETDALVARKAAAARAAGLTPVVCVGETLAERDAGDAERVVRASLAASLAGVGAGPLASPTSRFVVAYEPVWAIGTGRTATPEQAQAMHAALKAGLPAGTPVLYGGSVNAGNAAALFAQPDVDGALVGGASLDAAAFLTIARAAAAAAAAAR